MMHAPASRSMAVITILGAGVMGSAMTLPARDRGHEVRLVGTHLDRRIIDSVRSHRPPSAPHRRNCRTASRPIPMTSSRKALGDDTRSHHSRRQLGRHRLGHRSPVRDARRRRSPS